MTRVWRYWYVRLKWARRSVLRLLLRIAPEAFDFLMWCWAQDHVLRRVSTAWWRYVQSTSLDWELSSTFFANSTLLFSSIHQISRHKHKTNAVSISYFQETLTLIGIPISDYHTARWRVVLPSDNHQVLISPFKPSELSCPGLDKGR